MKVKSLLKTWGLFFILSLSTLLVYGTAWATDNYQLYLGGLGIASLIAAGWVLKNTGLSWSASLFIIIGLLVGQWWFIEGLLMQVSWIIKGFV